MAMSIERTYFCDAPDCEVHAIRATAPPYLPMGFFQVRTSEQFHHFCSWPCVAKFASEQPPRKAQT